MPAAQNLKAFICTYLEQQDSQKKSGCDAAYSSELSACRASRGVTGIIHSASSPEPKEQRSYHVCLALELPKLFDTDGKTTLMSKRCIPKMSSRRLKDRPAPENLICDNTSGRSGNFFSSIFSRGAS